MEDASRQRQSLSLYQDGNLDVDLVPQVKSGGPF